MAVPYGYGGVPRKYVAPRPLPPLGRREPTTADDGRSYRAGFAEAGRRTQNGMERCVVAPVGPVAWTSTR